MYPGLHWGASCKAPGKVAGKEAGTPGMGCTASVVQLQALRSLMRGSCARTCSERQEQISLEVLQSLDSEVDSRPRTIIITVIRYCSFLAWFPLGGSAKICSNSTDLFVSAVSGIFVLAICFPSVPLVVFSFLDYTVAA